MAELTPFLLPFFPSPEISSFWGTSIAITPLVLKRYFRPLQRGNIRLGDLFWPPPLQWPWHTHRFTSLLWQSLLSWHLLCSLLSCLFLLLGGALGPKFGQLPILLSAPLSPVFRPNKHPHPSTFRKLAGMTYPPTLTPTVFLQRNTRLFPLLLLSLSLWHWMRPNLPFLSAALNAILKPGGLLRRKVLLVKDTRLLLPLT